MPRASAPTPPGLGFTPFDSARIARPDLDKVLLWMRRFAHEGKGDLLIRRLMDKICSGLQSGDYASESLAAYYWVCRNLTLQATRWGRYARDPLGVEYVQTPRQLLASGAGDCDDQSVLIAALLMSYGNQAVFRVAAFGNPPMPSHVFCMVRTPGGPVPLDPVANRETAQMYRTMTAKQDYPLGEDGGGTAGLHGPGQLAAPSGGGKMRYSVYDYGMGLYTYFDGPGDPPATGRFRMPVGGINMPEVIAARLPSGCVKVGTGDLAQGVIATTTAGIGALSLSGRASLGGFSATSSPWLWVAAAGAIGYLAGVYKDAVKRFFRGFA